MFKKITVFTSYFSATNFRRTGRLKTEAE